MYRFSSAVLLLTGVAAQGGVFKCKTDAGKTIYSDTPCERRAGRAADRSQINE